MNTVLAHGLHGLPKYTRVASSLANKVQFIRTNPKLFSSGVDAAVMYEFFKLIITQFSKRTVAAPNMKSVVPSM